MKQYLFLSIDYKYGPWSIYKLFIKTNSDIRLPLEINLGYFHIKFSGMVSDLHNERYTNPNVFIAKYLGVITFDKHLARPRLKAKRQTLKPRHFIDLTNSSQKQRAH